MFTILRKVIRPNAHTRRVLSGLCAAFVLATLAISGIFVTVEADHDCHGYDCPVCQEIQACVANFQLLGSAAASGENPLPASTPSVVGTVPCTRRAPATTLQALDVRFDE